MSWEGAWHCPALPAYSGQVFFASDRLNVGQTPTSGLHSHPGRQFRPSHLRPLSHQAKLSGHSSVCPRSYFAWHSHRDCFRSSSTRDLSFPRRHHCHPFRPRCRRLPPPSRHRPQVRLLSSLSLSSPHLLDKPENILHISNDPDVTSSLACKSISLPLFIPSQRETSPFSRRATHPIAGSFGYVVPEVIKNTGRGVLAHRYDCFSTHTQMKHKLIALSPHSYHHLHSPLQLSLFLCQYYHYHCPVKRQLQNFRVHTGTRFRSSQVLHQMSPLPQFTPSSRFPGSLMQSLAYPYHHRRHAISHRPLPHFPTRLDSQSDIRAANRLSYFVVTTGGLSTSSSKGWHDQDDLRVGNQAL